MAKNFFTKLIGAYAALHLADNAGLFDGNNDTIQCSKYGSFGKRNVLYEPNGSGVTMSHMGILRSIDVKGIVSVLQNHRDELILLYWDETFANDVEIMFLMDLLFDGPDMRYLVHIAANKNGWILCSDKFQPTSTVKVELRVEIAGRIQDAINYYLKCRKEQKS